MFCVRKVIEMEKKDEIHNLRPLGDIHIGSIGFDVEKFESELEFIMETERYWTLCMGDAIDNIQAYAQGMIDKRWQPTHVTRKHLTTEEQVVVFTNYWSKVANKSLGIFSGNHEWKTITQQRFVRDFCNPVEMKMEIEDNAQRLMPVIHKGEIKPRVMYSNDYLGRMAYINLGFNYKEKRIRDYLILGHHGGYSGMQAGGGVNRMKMIAGDFDADIYLMGHTHDTWVRSSTRLGYDLKHNDILNKKIIMANTGTFLKSYLKNADNYEEINPREAKRTGTITVTFDPYHGKMYGHD